MIKEAFEELIEKKDVIRYVVIVGICVFLVGVLMIFRGGPTGFAVYEDSTQGDFDNGIYVNTTYNESAVVLVGSNLSGSYTSQVFDVGGDSVWNNISWNENEPILESFFCVDGGGEIYQSVNKGVNWSLKKENYGRTSDTQYMFSDSDYIYIISNSNKEVWRSNDLGVNWNVVNNSFADSGLLVGKKDSNDNLFVVDASGDVYLSFNNGVTWILLSDFNAGATNNAKGIGINSSDDIYIVDGSGDVYSSIDSGISWTKVNDGYGGGVGTDDMEVDDNDYLYILLASDVYQSTDNGVNWSKINDDFSPYSNEGKRMFSSGADLYIVDGVGRVFKSMDLGVSWIEIGDCTNSATNNPKGLTGFIQNTDLSFQVRSCNDAVCSGESWIEISDTSPQDLSIDDNRYFQYKISFSSPDLGITPELYNVTIDYSSLGPSISIVAPVNNETFTYNTSLPLNFTITNATALDLCWYTLNFGITNTTITNCYNTIFDAGDGNYQLYLYVNDTLGNLANDNVNFIVSAVGVYLSISEPKGIKNSRIGIPIQFSAVGNSLNCWYNVETSVGGSVIGNRTLENCSSSSFDVSNDGDYVFNLYVNNSLGVFETTNSSFSVDTSGPVPPSNGGSSGGGGGGYFPSELTGRMQVTQIGEIIAHGGDEKSLFLNVKNIGSKFLNNCRLIAKGDISSWIYLDQIEGIAPGENVDFNFNLNVPEEISAGDYSGELEIGCDEGKNTQEVNITIPGLESVEVRDLVQEKRELNINYSLNDENLIGKEISIEIWLVDREGVEIRRITDSFLVEGLVERSVLMKLPYDLAGVYFIYFAFSSDLDNFIRKSVVLGKSKTLGGVIIDGIKEKMTFYVLFLLILGVGVFFIWRRHKENSPHINKTKNRWLLKKRSFFK